MPVRVSALKGMGVPSPARAWMMVPSLVVTVRGPWARSEPRLREGGLPLSMPEEARNWSRVYQSLLYL